jgi:hypothetical protein
VPEMELIRVGDRTPSPGFVADLKAFDPDLKIKWSNPDQAWVVYQTVRRNRNCGEWNESSLFEVRNYDAPVLWLHGMREPDRRVLAKLYEKRALDKAERMQRAKRRVEALKKAENDKLEAKLAPAKEGMMRGAWEMRKSGVAGSIAPVYTPSGGMNQTKE